MVSFGQNFNRENLPKDELTPIPAGEYTVCIDSAEEDVHKNLHQKYLKLKCQIVDGEYSGRILFDNWYGLLPGTSGAFSSLGGSVNIEKISATRMGTLMDAVGIPQLQDTNQFVGQIVRAKVTQKGDFNNIQKFTPTTPVTPVQPQAQQPVQQTPPPGGSPWGA